MDLQQKFIDEDTNALESIRTTYNPFQILRNADSITPNDSTKLTNFGIVYVGTGGNIKVGMAGNDTAVTFTVESGDWLPLIVNKVYDTDTTASNIYVFW